MEEDIKKMEDNLKKMRKELRETETRLEDLSVETYQLLGEQPSPESETVLKPNSAQPIASD
jgi:tetrahydromethanopterin S-methyltransferase subunit G